MTETMTFPKTLDEFMEQYKIVDTEQVYTNGTELVPIFRIKQWEDAHQPRKGKWIHNGSQWKNRFLCSNCNYLWYFPAEEAHYCPNCGSQNEMEKANE